MPHRVRFDAARCFGVIELDGEVRWDDVAGAMRTLFGHPAWTPEGAVLWDGRAITALDIAPSDIPAIGPMKAAFADALEGGRTAVVARREVDAIMGSFLTRYGAAAKRRYGVFNRLDEALAFLEQEAVPADTAELTDGPRSAR